MTLFQYLSAFQIYKPDVLLLALGVTLTCSLLKKTVLKKCPKRLFVFLPFLIGLLFFGAFRAAVECSISPFCDELLATVEGGFACGCAATLYYVAYEQFIRKDRQSPTDTIDPLYPLLEGVVPDETREETAKYLLTESKTRSGEALYAFIKGVLAERANDPLSEEELGACAALLAKFLEQLKK